MGIGVALMQPTLPTLVGEWFADRSGFATAVYANGLLIGEAVPAALTIPLVLPWVGGSWEWSFAVWSAPVAVTLLLFILATTTPHRERGRPAESSRWWPDWCGALPLGMLLGGTGGLLFPRPTRSSRIICTRSASPALVGPSLTALNFGQLPASAVILAFARKMTGQSRGVHRLAAGWRSSGWPLFCCRQPGVIVAAMGLIGFCCGVQLILSFAMPPLMTPADDVHHLSAGTFAIGYLLSFVVPPLGGAIWDATGVPATAFLASILSTALVVGAAAMLPQLRTAPAGSARRR